MYWVKELKEDLAGQRTIIIEYFDINPYVAEVNIKQFECQDEDEFLRFYSENKRL